jgi:glycosidase
MTDALKFWVSETQVDGYRSDVAGMVPVAFWEQARKELDSIKPVFMLAEDEGQRDLMQRAFDANYAWEFHHIMNQIAKGEKNAADVWSYFAKEDTLFAPSSYRMMFTSNHDENSWNGTEFERLGEGAKAFAVMTYTLPGFPLIYNGQETGLDRRLSFFEKDSIVWDVNSEFAGFYANLNQMKHDNKSLWNGSNGGTLMTVGTDKSGEILSFTREKDQNKLLVLINLTNNEQQFKLFETNLSGNYTNLLTNQPIQLTAQQEMTLPIYGFMVLKAD